METPPPLPDRSPSRRASVALKIAVIAAVILVLQIPLLLIRGTLDERRARRAEAVQDISRTWGEAQTIAGPMLVVPYTLPARTQRETVVDGRVVKTDEVREMSGQAWFLPSRLEVGGEIEPEERHRGIFRTAVYAARLQLAGEFSPDVDALGLERAVFDWSRARVVVGLSDPRGLRAAPQWDSGGRRVAFAPAAPRDGWLPMIEAATPARDAAGASGAFAVELTLQGTERLSLAPVGAVNRASLRAAWPDPSFDGRYLPVEREVGPEGFTARWETAYFGRGYPQQWAEHAGGEGVAGFALEQSAFGVTLATPVDAYRLVERSLKYALLFLVLVFAVFFLFEMTARTSVHAVQYLMVGAALTLFYLGVLALSEFVGSGAAYAAGAAVSTLLIAGYSWAILEAGGRACWVGSGIAATYGYLYFVLQLQDFALLAGTAALFALLAGAMWVTRRLDWLRPDTRARSPSAATAP